MFNKKKVFAFAVMYLALLVLTFAAVTGPRQLAGFLAFNDDHYTCKNCNVILISIDTLRADHLGVYGYYRNTSPNIDEFAKDAIVFENAFAQAPWTLSSHASMLSGVYPSKTGVWDYLLYPVDNRSGIKPLSGKLTMLAEVFNQSNYTTIALTDDGYVSSRYGFGQGFNEYHEINTLNESNYYLLEQNMTRLAQKQPFFLFLHTYNVHVPYDPPPPYNALFYKNYSGHANGSEAYIEQLILTNAKEIPDEDRNYLVSLYDGEVAYTDYEIGKFLKLVSSFNLTDNTIIIIVSDHGESFFENFDGHNYTQYLETTSVRLMHRVPFESVMKVPIIMRLPKKPFSERIDKNVGLLDIFPTILQINGLGSVQVNQSLDGINLFNKGKNGAQLYYEDDEFSGKVSKAMYITIKKGRYKYVRKTDGKELLFELANDPNETSDLSELNADEGIINSFRKDYDVYITDVRGGVPLPYAWQKTEAPSKAGYVEPNDRVKQKLKSLGYIE